jgi:hypothetical protein
MTRQIIATVAAVFLLAVTATNTLAASNLIHFQLVEHEESVMVLSGDFAACVGYSGTMYEDRNYDVRVTEFVSGPRTGDVHLTGSVTGLMIITPDDPEAGPVYTGDVREKVVFRGTSLDDPLGVAFVLHVRLTGSDGSSLRILYHGHGTAGRDGKVRLHFDRLHCAP